MGDRSPVLLPILDDLALTRDGKNLRASLRSRSLADSTLIEAAVNFRR